MSHDFAISTRIRLFLAEHPPFSFCTDQEIQSVIDGIEVEVAKKGSLVFEKGQPPMDAFFMVRKGAVTIEDDTRDLRMLIDQCGEGDIFGMRPILADSPYLFHAVIEENAILYRIPFERFKPIFNQNTDVAAYMAKRFAADLGQRESAMQPSVSLIESMGASGAFRMQFKKELIHASRDKTIQEACEQMSVAGVGSILILNDAQHPIGIVTDRDIRHLVARAASAEAPIEEIMSQPVQCIHQDASLPEVQLSMMETGFHHLCVTEDGTPNSRAIGMITEHDLLFAHSSDPVVLVKEIKHAKDVSALTEIRTKMDRLAVALVDDDLNPEIPLTLTTRLNRLLVRKVVELTLVDFDQIEPDSFAFFTMGSMARGEQVFRTDQDNGLILANSEKDRKELYLEFGRAINNKLENIGYEWCPAEMMACNPMWCRTVEEYEAVIKNWIHQPGPEEVLLTATFFDFHHEYGSMELSQQIRQTIKSEMTENSLYLRFLAQHAIKYPPPLSFFRKFLVEKGGEHADQFDIKLRGLAPLVDAVRCLALAHGFLDSTNTIHRLEFLKSNDSGNLSLYSNAEKAFYALLTLRVMFHIKNQDGGRFISIDQLDKLQRIELRQSFGPTRSLQEILHRKFKLGYL